MCTHITSERLFAGLTTGSTQSRLWPWWRPPSEIAGEWDGVSKMTLGWLIVPDPDDKGLRVERATVAQMRANPCAGRRWLAASDTPRQAQPGYEDPPRPTVCSAEDQK